MGKDGNELKYQFQKFPNTVYLYSFSPEQAWWEWARTGDSQRQYSIAIRTMRWCHRRAGICRISSSHRWMLYSWGWNSPAAEVNKTLLSILVYIYASCCLTSCCAALISKCSLSQTTWLWEKWSAQGGFGWSPASCTCDAFWKQNWHLPPPTLPASFQQEPFIHYKATYIKIRPLLYNGDCNASPELLAHCGGNVTDSMSQAL